MSAHYAFPPPANMYLHLNVECEARLWWAYSDLLALGNGFDLIFDAKECGEIRSITEITDSGKT